MSETETDVSWNSPVSATSEYNLQRFMMRQMMGRISTATLVKIIKQDFGLTIDIEELINEIDRDMSGQVKKPFPSFTSCVRACVRACGRKKRVPAFPTNRSHTLPPSPLPSPPRSSSLSSRRSFLEQGKVWIVMWFSLRLNSTFD